MNFPGSVRIVEVGPRDGLQNEKTVLPVADRVALIEALADAGLKRVECGSFVSPKWVPQMAETGAVLAGVHRIPGVSYSVLVPNLKGLAAAVESGVQEVAIFAAASETFSQHNINCSIGESLARLRGVAEAASVKGIKVRGYVSCVLGCPYEGEVPIVAVARVASALHNMGCYEISLGDTIGVGTPLQTRDMLEGVAANVPVDHIAVHFHDTYGQALANILASLDFGVTVIDSAVAGVGGCPYAPGAAGNVATEDVLYMLNGMRIETGVDIEKLAAAGRWISHKLGRSLTSKAGVAMAARDSQREARQRLFG